MWLHLWGGRHLVALLLGVIALWVASPAWSGQPGQMHVSVVDEIRRPLPGVVLQLSGEQLIGGAMERYSDPNGEALFMELPPGIYRVSASRPGYTSVTMDNLQVSPNQTTRHVIQLRPGTGEEVLTKAYLQQIPAGRTYQSAVQTVPGATSAMGGRGAGRNRPDTAGASANENTYAAAPPPTAQLRGPPPLESVPAAQRRMVHYDGWVALSVPDPRETIDEVRRIAEEAGGRIEKASGTMVSVRVPVAAFREIWQEVLGLGEPIDRLVRAEDVTEQYTATELRRDALAATRERLLALLAQAKTESEKLRLLAEISRLTEQLDVLDAKLRTLSDLASMSRITVEVVPSQSFAGLGARRPEAAAMAWITELTPFRRGPWADPFRVALPLPNQMVPLSEKGPFVAESPGGTVWWAMRLPNEPVGTATFWADTLKDRLASEFAEATRSRRGSWECLVLREPGTKEAYRWDLCVRTVGEHLHVSQTYYPTQAQVERYSQAIERSMSADGGGS